MKAAVRAAEFAPLTCLRADITRSVMATVRATNATSAMK